MSKIRVTKLENLFVIVKDKDSDFFITSENTIIIPSFNLFSILKFMLFRGLMSPKVLEGLLSEYREV